MLIAENIRRACSAPKRNAPRDRTRRSKPKKCGSIALVSISSCFNPAWTIGSIWRGGCSRTLPKRGNPAFFFHPVQGGKERAWLDNKVPLVICWILREIPIRASPSNKAISGSAGQSPLAKGSSVQGSIYASYRLSIGTILIYV